MNDCGKDYFWLNQNEIPTNISMSVKLKFMERHNCLMLRHDITCCRQVSCNVTGSSCAVVRPCCDVDRPLCAVVGPLCDVERLLGDVVRPICDVNMQL